MTAKDLMIGDYVQYKRTKEIIRIFEIDSDINVINDNPDGYYSEKNISIDNIKPIPLTSEILEKNGLEKDNYGRLYGEYFDEDIYKYLEITVDSKTKEVWWSYNWNEYYIIRLRYVHELQHALRLCGIEKEIIL